MISSSYRRTVALLGVAVVIAGTGAVYAATAGPSGRAVTTTTLAPASTTSAPEATTTSVAVTSTQTPTTTAAAPPPTAATPAPTTSSTRPHPARVVVPQAWVPYARAGGVELRLPSDRVEAIGFHQSGHDGAQDQAPLNSGVRWFTMESRDRDTVAHGAADIVVEPDREVRVPVSGTVVRAGTYTLYCDHVDQYAVIEPDAHPGWEVKILHVEGLSVRKGQRVEAGTTRLAARARVLPFPSQVEDDTGLPAWPHLHLEVVDPSVKDRPTGPGCP